jgi:hypothetical protein
LTTTTKQTTNDKPAAAFVEVRGESGRLFGMLDVRTGIIHIRQGKAGHGNGRTDRCDITPYLKIVEQAAKQHDP